MKRIAPFFFLLLAAAVPATAGLADLDNPGPAVTSVAMRQRYPWNGLMDVDVTFEGKSGETYRIELTATDKTGGTNLPVRTAWLEGAESAVGNPVDVPAPGTHRLVWNAGADLPAGFVADRVTVSAKLLNPIWSFASIPEIDPDDVWAPATVYHDVQTIAAYGEIEDHEPTVRCLTDEWNLEDSLGANVVFSGSSMGLRKAEGTMTSWGAPHPISLWAWSDTTNRFRMVNIDYENGHVACRNPVAYNDGPHADARFFSLKNDPRQYLIVARDGYHCFWKSGGSEMAYNHLGNHYGDDKTGSAVCSYFPNGVPFSDETSTTVPSSYDKNTRASVFFAGETGTDRKQAVIHGGGSPGVDAGSMYSCMGNPVGRYVVPLLDGNTFFTVAYPANRAAVVQHFALAVGKFSNYASWDFIVRATALGYDPSVAWSKGVAMPDGRRIFLGGAGRNRSYYNGSVRMWQGSDALATHAMYPYGHPFESWARRDVTCLLPNGKFCGVDEELGLVVVNPLTGETYVASDDPAFKKGKMGCQLLPNGKVWIIPYDCEGREYLAGTNLCGKLYEVDFGFTRSFSLSSLMSPYLRVAEGDPEPSGIKVGLDPNGGELPGIYAMYYKGANPVYGELPVPTWTGHTFLGWSTDGTAANLVAATDPVPPLGILLKAAWQAHTYTVKFNRKAEEATGTMANQSFSYGIAQALTANAFARTGYAFSGWATSPSGAKLYNDRQTVSNLTATAGGTVNLYATWTANSYSVKFNKNATDATGSMSNESFAYGTAKALTANSFARTGYTFGGWATSATGAKVYNDKQSVSNLTTTSGGTVYLYAVWTPISYSVKFNANGGSGSMSNESFTYGTAKALTANAFTRTGYTFGGWATSANGAKAYNDKQSVSNLTSTAGGTVNLYAKWTANTYSVKFNKNATDATGSMSNESFAYGSAKALTANSFARTGYTFGGWATSANGAKAYNDKQSVSNLTATAGGTVNLYAKWTANTYTVKFNANGGSGTMSNQSFTYGVAQALTANAFTRTGYTFTGWATSATGAKVYNNKESVSNLTATQGATYNLYAAWNKNDRMYMVVDLSRGSSASSYPVSYLSDVPEGGWTEEYQTTKLVLRYVEPGTYNMGSPSSELGRANNEPRHQVMLTKPFYIGVFACSQKQWQLVKGSNPITYEPLKHDEYVQTEISYNDIRGSSQGAQWPASSAVDSTSFLGRMRSRTGLAFDLPTEAQWEYACRAGTTTAYNLGLDLPSSDPGEISRFVHNNNIARCSYYYNSLGATMFATPSGVGIGIPNNWGLYAMHGNTWEWCLDWYSVLGTGAATDPVGATSGDNRVLRGGSSHCMGDDCRSARRTSLPPDRRFDGFNGTMNNSTEFVGFRLCLPLDQ